MNEVVVDSGIIIASVMPETLTLQAKQLTSKWKAEKTLLHAPSLFSL